MWRIGLLGIGLFVSCAEPEARFLAVPELAPQTRSLLAVFYSGGRIVVSASKRDDASFEWSFPSSEGADLFLIPRPESLAELGLQAGPVGAVARSFCASRTLPFEPGAWFGARYSGGELSDWTLEAPVPTAVSEFRYAVPCPCRDFEYLAGVDVPGVFHGLEPSRNGVWISTRIEPTKDEAIGIQVMYWAGTSSAVQIHLTQIPLWRPGYVDLDGSLWMYARTSSVMQRVWPDGRATLVGGSGLNAVGGITGPSSGTVQEVTAIDKSGRVASFDGRRWTLLNAMTLLAGGSRQSSRILWLGPGHVLATLENSLAIIEIENGQVTIPIRHNDSPVVEIADAPHFGILAAAFGGVLGLIKDGDFVSFEPAITTDSITSGLGPHPRGAVIGRRSEIQQFDFEAGLCAPRTTGISAIEQLKMADDGTILIGGSSAEGGSDRVERWALPSD